jgi:hypothetical protein
VAKTSLIKIIFGVSWLYRSYGNWQQEEQCSFCTDCIETRVRFSTEALYRLVLNFAIAACQAVVSKVAAPPAQPWNCLKLEREPLGGKKGCEKYRWCYQFVCLVEGGREVQLVGFCLFVLLSLVFEDTEIVVSAFYQSTFRTSRHHPREAEHDLCPMAFGTIAVVVFCGISRVYLGHNTPDNRETGRLGDPTRTVGKSRTRALGSPFLGKVSER